MEHDERAEGFHLIKEHLKRQAHRYDFYQITELLYRILECEVAPRVPAVRPGKLNFRASPDLGFAASDVKEVYFSERGGATMEVSFLGLHGSQSPLPGFYVESIARHAAHSEGVSADFLDFFHNRLIHLLFLVWRKYRYHIRFTPGGNDQLSNVVFSCLGLGSREKRQKLQLPWNYLLANAGLLAANRDSVTSVIALISRSVNHPEVTIKQWVPRSLKLQPHQLSALGAQNMSLGENLILGERVLDVSSKFAICFRNISFNRLTGFFPGREYHLRLVALLEYVLSSPLLYEFRLELNRKTVPAMRLGDSQCAHLGLTTFLLNKDEQQSSPYLINIQTTAAR